MYLLKKMLGFGNDLKSEMSQINIPCTLYQVEKNERNHMITKSMLTISGD